MSYARFSMMLLSIWMFVPKLQGSPQDAKQQGAPSLLLLVDGDSGRHTDWVGAMVHLFQSRFNQQGSLRIGVFDEEPDYRTTVSFPVNSPMFPLAPRTPLKDAVETCINNGNWDPPESKKVIVILIHEESYGSWFSAARLRDSAGKSGVTIYAILLEATEREHKKPPPRLRSALTDAMIWVGDGLADDPVPSRRSTFRMLGTITSGKICRAENESAAIHCADQISSELSDPAR